MNTKVTDISGPDALLREVDLVDVAGVDVLDDFPMLWTWFEEDAILAEMGKPRLHTDDGGLPWGWRSWQCRPRSVSLQERLWLSCRAPLRAIPSAA